MQLSLKCNMNATFSCDVWVLLALQKRLCRNKYVNNVNNKIAQTQTLTCYNKNICVRKKNRRLYNLKSEGVITPY